MDMSLGRNPTCPYCRGTIELKTVHYRDPFRCPNCHIEVQVSKIYSQIGFWVSAVVSAALCWSLHLRDGGFLLGFLVFLFPAMFSVGIVLRRVYPPKLVI
jgi:hypothetical protein